MKRPGDLGARLVVAVVGIPVVFGAVYRGGWVLGGLLAVIAAVGAWEFFSMMRLRGDRPFTLLGMVGAGGMVLLASADPSFAALAPRAVALLLVLTGACLALSLALRWPGGSPAGALGATLSGTAYVGLPLAFLPLLRELGDQAAGGLGASGWTSLAFVLFPLLTIWASDTAAYFVGIAIGRVRLAPSVSPKKSVEGAVAGVIGGVIAAALVSSWWLADLPRFAVPVGTAAWMGGVLSVGGQVGDLVESVLKREAGVKDSSGLLPGHGGFLDRLDALLWAFPLAWGLLALSGVLS
jgi:phosphatidate cytidylyltransferase